MASVTESGIETRPDAGARYSVWAFLAPLLGVALGLALLYGLMRAAQAHYAERIYPGVSVEGVSVGGMTRDTVRLALEGLLAVESTAAVVLSDGQEEWAAPWAQLGLTPDIEAAVEAAFAIGHGPEQLSPRAWMEVWLVDHPLRTPFQVNAVVAREALTSAAPALNRAPTIGTFQLQEGRVVVAPGAAGRELDVDASLEALLSVAQGAPEPVQLVFREVPAPVPDPAPLQAEVDRLMARTIAVSSYDPVSDTPYHWDVSGPEIDTWLRLAEEEDGAADRVIVDPAGVEATLRAMAESLGDGRGFRMEEAVPAMMDAFEAGGGAVTLYMTHPERRYTVQAGDTALVVAARHGMPLWPLSEANPGIDLDALSVGQELVIPSQDVLIPHLPVPGKRIVISIAEQRMWVYEDGALIHDWQVSTGRDGSPTHSGVFQVLSKEENAYASLWDLHMPHFIGIYASGPGFLNGIHALPILSSGQRLWEGALGTRASYGCIILGVAEAAELYAWAEIGVTVEVRP